MMNTTKKKLYGALAVALTMMMMVVGATVALGQWNTKATAEAVTVSENATVVTSPFTEAVAKVKDSVVGVNNYTNVSQNNYYGFGDFFGNGNSFGDNGGSDNSGSGNSGSSSDSGTNSREVLQSSGSGVVVADGYVLTNYHVVEGASSLEVTSGDKTYTATVVGSDENLDLAVLKVDKLDLTPVTLGDSDKLSVGDWAICIGNPLSFTGTTTVGVISALNREVASENYDQYGLRQDDANKMIQTDAAINAGNSGGGMFNVAGELIGVPSMKYTGSYYSTTSVEGIGMAIPINVAKPLINDVLAGKTTSTDQSTSASGSASSTDNSKPRIGVTVTNATNFSSYAVQQGVIPNGAYVTDVESGSPADTAGIQKGDIIVQADGTVITSTSQLISILQAKNAGDSAEIKLYRAEGITDAKSIDDIKTGEYKDVTVTLAMLDNVKQ
ncbi:MAG TPA: trypsin-like peptidase domain-containing protein [Candidatus Limiplasma sp.]|nr:trypsin-like peptidase domain-containing protein [Candidatus Limiplasma sp.]